MDAGERTKLIRMFEAACKESVVWADMISSVSKYQTIKNICLDLDVLTIEQVEEMEAHMKEQHGKGS